MPSSSTYKKLQAAAQTTKSWDAEIVAARAVLADRDPAGFIDALLADGESDEAWNAATSTTRELASSQWQRLAEAREASDPADAMAVYLRLTDDVLQQADRHAYQSAVRLLKAARRAATAADLSGEFSAHLAALRERNRRRPTLMSMLDKAGLK